MKLNYFLKKHVFIFLISILSTPLWAIDVTVPLGGDIQAGIDLVAASGGGIVTVAAGTHVITTPLKIKSNVTIQGEGNWATKIKTNTNIEVINAYAEGLVNLVIQNIEIEGINGANGGGIIITSQGVDHENIKLLNVHCLKTGWGVHIKGAKNLLVKDCLFEQNGTVGQEGFAHNMYLRRVTGAIVRDSKFLNSISANGINISYSSDIKVYNCEMSGNYFRGIRAAVTDGFLVHDCIVNNNGDRGIFANSETGETATVNIDIRRNCVSGNALQGIAAISGVTGVTSDNNSYNNGTDYDFPSSVSSVGNITDSSIGCNYSVDSSIILKATSQADNSILLDWGLKNITLGTQNIYRNTSSDSSGRSLIASNVTGDNYSDTTAAKDVMYWYWIEATDTKTATTYNSNAAPVEIITLPTIIFTANPGNASITLNWEILGIDLGTTGVAQIFRQVVSSTNETQQASQTKRSLLKNNVTGNTFTDVNVYNGNVYKYGFKVTDKDAVVYNAVEVQISPSAALSVEDKLIDTKLSVYPNPATNNITVRTPIAAFSEYTISDMSGRISLRGAIKKDAAAFNVDVSKLAKGIYLVTVKDNHSAKTVKIVKK